MYIIWNENYEELGAVKGKPGILAWIKERFPEINFTLIKVNKGYQLDVAGRFYTFIK